MRNSNLDLQASHKMLMIFEQANANTEMVIDQFPGIFLIINANHEILRANREFVTLLETDSERIFRQPLSSFFRQKSWEMFAHNIKRLTTPDVTCDIVRFELGLSVGCPAEGEERPFHWIITRHNIRNRGEGQLIIVYGSDMTEIREAEKRMMEVFTSIPLGIFTADRMGRIGASYSSYLETMLDCEKPANRLVEDILFKPALKSIDANARKGVNTLLNCLGRSGLEFPELEKTFPHKIYHNPKPDEKEGRWLKISYHPIINDNVIDQMLIILEDTTAIVKAEQDVMAAAKEREKASIIQLQSQAVYESAIRDPLTGLYTRLYMKDSVASMLSSHNNGEVATVSMVIFDIDHFKHVNDTYGHKNGDLVLGQVAKVVLKQTRETDIPIRFGGEEFVVFLPAPIATATLLAERVRKAVEVLDVELDGVPIKLTISGGIAAYRKGETLEDFMHRADQYLYKAKEGGRNRNVSET